MGTVFISYRREDTEGQARALSLDLTKRLGNESVFMDVDSIALGRDFREILQERLASCDVMLALIGREWVDCKDASGQRRLDNSGDFVRMEIAAALKRNIPVTPLLLQGAHMPAAEQLPDDLKDLAYRNGFELSHNRWESDVEELIKRLGLGARSDMPTSEKTGSPKIAPRTAKKSWFAIAGLSVVAIAIVGGLLYYQTVTPEPEPQVKATEKGNYHVVVESSNSESQAIKKSEDLRKNGYDSEVHLTPKGYAVTIGHYSSKEADNQKAKAIKAGFKDAWVSEGKTWLKKVFP
jgi:Sporulation related domain.